MSNRKKQNAEKVPAFKNRMEEARFWDSHSPLDFPDYWEEADVTVEKPVRHEIVLSVRLDEDTVSKMEEEAKQKHIGKSTLARMLIVQGLERKNTK